MVAVSAILEVVVVCAGEARETASGDEPPGAPPRGPRNQSSLHKGNTENYVKNVAQFSPAAAIPRTTPSNRKIARMESTDLHSISSQRAAKQIHMVLLKQPWM